MTATRPVPTRRIAARWAPALLFGVLIAGCGGGGKSHHQMAPAVTLAATPTSIVLGQSTTLTWSSPTGTTCTASGGWTGSEPASGTADVVPASTGSVTYSLTCGGGAYGGGGTSVSATVSVSAPSAYSATKLAADTAGTGAVTTDADLLNPWGIAFGPTSPVWVANNHSETSTLYDGNGKAQPAATPLVVGLPASGAGVSFDPTGIVFNGSGDFVISANGVSGPARFIFDGEGGMIAGWASSVDPTAAVAVYVDTGGAVYKGLAIASNGTASFLYATDFKNRKIDVFDASFHKQTPSATSFAFDDPTLPDGYAPFGIQALPTGAAGAAQIYVSYALQAPPDNTDEQHGAGLGLVDVFDTNGVLVKHLILPGGRLNAPWGMALAPSDFGTLSNAVLVGNFGDGTIEGFDPESGRYLGTVSDAGGTPFAAPGLWGIAFGNGADNQPTNSLFFAAGLNDESDGEYGRIDVGAAPPVLGTPPDVTVTSPAAGATVSGTTTLTATATSSINIKGVEFFANGGTSLGIATSSPYSIQWDTTKFANGTVTLTATATDVDGNVATSPAVAVTVSNGTAAAKLSDIQARVFTPICSACHNGTGSTLPGVQNLTAGNSFASLVNVPSIEQPGLMRVKPGDPANSYIIQKLEGAAGISGSRMPLGGPYLDQATIDMIKSWIAAGAQND